MPIALLLGALLFAAAFAGDTYQNPVNPDNRPDPGVLPIMYNGSWYVATTTGGSADTPAFPIMTSPDLVNWTQIGYIFDSVHPTWATGNYWAPEIHQISDNVFHVYFVATNQAGTLCVGLATSTTPRGPYVDSGACFVDTVGMGEIDPTFFKDDNGSMYIIWKTDGNAVGQRTPIWIQALNETANGRVGPQVQAITNDLPFEGAITEAPWMVKVNGTYYLFYSANAYNEASYCVSVARSTTGIFGPYVKFGSPILQTLIESEFAGPGHCSVLQPQTQGGNSPYQHWYMIYHAWQSDAIGTGVRQLLVDEVLWTSDGWPYVNGDHPNNPSSHPEPYPN